MMTRTGWLAALDARIEREIRRMRARYDLSLDEFRGLYISDEQVDRLVAASGEMAHDEPPRDVERPCARIRTSDPRWRDVAETFALSPLEEDLLLIGLAPELDQKYETLYAYLNDDAARRWPTGNLAERLLGDVASDDEVARALAPGASLHARGLIRRVDGGGRPALSNTGFAVDPCVTHWIRGVPPGLAFDSAAVEWQEPSAIAVDQVAAARATPILRLLERSAVRASELPIIAVVGQAGAGRTRTAAAVASASGRPLVRVDLARVAEGDTNSSDLLERIGIALALVPAVVLLDLADQPQDAEGDRRRIRWPFSRSIARWPASALVVVRADAPGQVRWVAGGRRVIEIPCRQEHFSEHVAAWRDAAQAADIHVSPAELTSLAGRFALTAGQVRSVLATARDIAVMNGALRPDVSQIAASARLASDQSLERIAVKVECRQHWRDLVLPGATLDRLEEFAAAIRHRHVVFGEWGFGERLVHGAGIKALFAGASGTGKTMAAGVIARELGLDLFKIDLSGVVSKYIGETEKNLDRVFNAARCSNAILFLDEADAIMGKRSEVKDAHDRYANIEVAYLLQRLEEHDGVVILATNLRRNIDEAFNRRMQYIVDFPRPEEEERERIWRGMFPPRSPLAADVDFGFLARQFDLAGGEIRNVVLDAAFIAARDGGAIGMRAIIEALTRQLARQGKTPTATDFRQYQRLRPVAGGKRDER